MVAVRRRLLRYVLRCRDRTLLPSHVVLPHDVVSSEMLVLGLHEGDVLRILFDRMLAPLAMRFKEAVALDVGANIGNHSLYMSRFFSEVVAVEPNPDALHVLRANVGLSGRRIDVVDAGFSYREGLLNFIRDTAGNLGASRFSSGVDERQTIECRVERGDTTLRRKGLLGRIAFVKIDAEGHEPQVIRGLSSTLSNHPVLAFECLNSRLDGSEVFELLRSFGYARFFSIETSGNSAKNRVSGWLSRLTRGDEVIVSEVVVPERRDYEMIVALSASDAELVLSRSNAE